MMEVISTRRYEARPASTVATPNAGSLMDHENGVATVKEGESLQQQQQHQRSVSYILESRLSKRKEWETRKKKEITTTRQIETRVKRQVVLEDGEVVVDSGPVVTTNTTEDVEQQEHTTHERKTAGDEPKEIEWSKPEDRQEISGVPSILQKESNETVVRSREEIEERLETEDRQQLGDISDDVYLKAVQNNRGDLRVALAESSKQVVPAIGPRVVQHTTRSNKVTDTENKLEKSQVQADGRIVTETKKTVEHEEVNDDEVPDKETDNFGDAENEVRKEGSHRFLKQKDEELVDYVSGGERVAREMRYISENTEGERTGDWPPVPTTMRTTRLHKHTGLPENVPINRKDALTKKPLDLEEEDEARKVETSKWLESHFGSESRSSHGSLDLDDQPVQSGTNTSFINVTMKSLPMTSARDRDGWDRNHPNTSYPSHQHSQTKKPDRRDSNSSAGYFHGISEWSERYQNQNTTEKQNSQVSNTSPTSYPDNVRSNGYQEAGRNPVEWTYSNNYGSSRQQHQESRSKIELQDTIDAPSPPLRRRAREQLLARQEDKNQAVARVASPVNVVQRTWESRSRAIQKEKESVNHSERIPSHKVSARSGSTSPIPAALPSNQTKKVVSPAASTRTPKAAGHSKYKIGESFRKLVGKLRSASSERKNKRNNTASSVTQTDDTSTYLQYNVIDKNIPSVTDYDSENKPPERPPRSPKPAKAHWQQSNEGPPVQRYYLGEDPFGGSIYGREMGYSGSKPASRHHQSIREDPDPRVESSSIGRFSKSTSRLANEYDRNEQFRSTQTLPRKLHNQARQHHVTSSTLTRTRPNQRQQKPQSPQTVTHSINNRQYGSMINISIKNTVTSSKLAANNSSGPVPSKPERSYKSSLLRSKSFNVEANRDNNEPNSVPHKSNLQLNRLDETPPLKSPGILASISRSNRDLFKAAKYEY